VTAKQLIAAARTAGIRLDACGDRLVYQAPRGVLTPHLRDALVRHKLDLLAVLWRLDAMRRLGVDLSGANSRPPLPWHDSMPAANPGAAFRAETLSATPRRMAAARLAMSLASCFIRSSRRIVSGMRNREPVAH
jgi:hypothetical protein